MSVPLIVKSEKLVHCILLYVCVAYPNLKAGGGGGGSGVWQQWWGMDSP